MVQARRGLYLKHCELEEAGKGLVDAILGQHVFERERTIHDIIPAFPVDAVSTEIIYLFLPLFQIIG